jgi:hypothetical protein
MAFVAAPIAAVLAGSLEFLILNGATEFPLLAIALARAISAVETRLSDVMSGPPARPGCIPATTTERATTESLPAYEEKLAPTPEQLNPGLAPSMGAPKIY